MTEHRRSISFDPIGHVEGEFTNCTPTTTRRVHCGAFLLPAASTGLMALPPR